MNTSPAFLLGFVLLSGVSPAPAHAAARLEVKLRRYTEYQASTLRQEVRGRAYDHVSVHVGKRSGDHASTFAPLKVRNRGRAPRTAEVIVDHHAITPKADGVSISTHTLTRDRIALPKGRESSPELFLGNNTQLFVRPVVHFTVRPVGIDPETIERVSYVWQRGVHESNVPIARITERTNPQFNSGFSFDGTTDGSSTPIAAAVELKDGRTLTLKARIGGRK